MAKKKHPKMDKNWVSLQPHELRYIATKFEVSVGVVREAKKSVGKSRQKVYAYIRRVVDMLNSQY